WDVLPVAQRYGMGVIVWSPLAGGWLAGRYRKGEGAPSDSRLVRYKERGSPVAKRYDPSVPENERKLDVVEELVLLAEKAGTTITHLAIAFTLAHPAVASSIIGPRTPEQLTDLLAGADVRLDADTLDAIDELVAPGSVVFDFDRGYSPPWMAPEARRR
ncbi:MAG: aldo/keto reductase, partial [Actinobacteria bacterium]